MHESIVDNFIRSPEPINNTSQYYKGEWLTPKDKYSVGRLIDFIEESSGYTEKEIDGFLDEINELESTKSSLEIEVADLEYDIKNLKSKINLLKKTIKEEIDKILDDKKFDIIQF